MRRLLGVLRTEAAGPEHLPQPALDQLPTLVAQTERAGLPVRLQFNGTRRDLPVGVELNAFRIVQEALTNTLKHAGPSHASVELSYTPTSLEVQVSDDGRGFSAKATPGHGLIGMRQRTTLLGGELTISRGPASGVTITASLPIE
jgi:signal transduction histidine kinase